MSNNILVRWESEDGWREGVLMCCVVGDEGHAWWSTEMEAALKLDGIAIIRDRHRNERAIVPLGSVRLIPPRCPRCDGEGEVDAVATTGNGQGAAYRCKTTCECQRVPNAS